MPMKAFRAKEWIQGGIFSDVCRDDFVVSATVARGLYRQRVPSWDNAACAAPCEFRCPASIPTQLRYNLLRAGKVGKPQLVLDHTPFPARRAAACVPTCMEGCTRGGIDKPSKSERSGAVPLMCPRPVPGPTGKSGRDRRRGRRLERRMAACPGHEVTVYEADERMAASWSRSFPRPPSA
ncbi:MAG: hypothetical protein ACLRWP_21180 [Bilophila wadsworthia]